MVDTVSYEPKGYRDVHWCPYVNEPYISEYNKDDQPDCPLCDGNYEPETHQFICHVYKPVGVDNLLL